MILFLGIDRALLGSTSRYTLTAQAMTNCSHPMGKDREVGSLEDLIWRTEEEEEEKEAEYFGKTNLEGEEGRKRNSEKCQSAK